MTFRAWLKERQGLLLGIGLATAVVAAAGIGTEEFHTRELRRAEAAATADAAREAQAARLVILRSLDAADALDQAMRERVALLAQDNGIGAAALEAVARRVVARRAFGVLQVSLVDRYGRVAWSSVEGWQPVDLSDRAHIRAHMPRPDGSLPPDRLYVSEPLIGRVSNQPTLQFTRAVRDADGGLAHMTVVSIDPLDISRLMQEMLPGDRGTVALLREDGVFLARNREPGTSIGRNLPPESPTATLMRAGTEGEVRTRGTLGGRDIFIGLRRLPGTPLYVTASIDAETALAPVHRQRALLRAGTVALAILAFGLVWLLHQREQRRRGQAALAAAEAVRQELALVLEGLPGAAYRAEVDRDGGFRFLYGSPAITPLTGLRRAELQDLAAWEARTEALDPPGRLRDLPMAAIEHGRHSADLLFRRPDGTRRWLRATMQVVRRHGDGRTELVGYTSDVTEQREAQSAIFNSAKLATLGEMATGLAHELNQPISTMALAAENAANSLTRNGERAIPDALRRLERIGLLAQRAKGIIDHLRAFGRVDPGQLEAVSLAQAVAGATVLTGAALREAEIALTADLPGDLPPVRGRALLLEQVLINLLLNARDAMVGAGAAERRIRLAARAEGDAVVLTVADSGPGIPEAVLPRLFEPFFTTKPPGEGTGLGLSLCHGIMQSIGGDIAARNTGQGAEFRVTLRVADATPPAQAAAPEQDLAPGEAGDAGAAE